MNTNAHFYHHIHLVSKEEGKWEKETHTWERRICQVQRNSNHQSKRRLFHLYQAFQVGDVKAGHFRHTYLKSLSYSYPPHHTTHIRHQYEWGEISTHHKWDRREENFRYTQHWKTDWNTTANIHWKSDTQLWRPSSHQNYHCMVQQQETTWRRTAHEQKIHSS